MCLVSGKLALSKGPVIKYRVGGGGGVGVGYENFSFKYWFSMAHP